MNTRFKALLLLVLMLLAAGGAYGLRPTQKIADVRDKIDLESMIPRSFGEWHELLQGLTPIVDPQQKETINKLYSQTLTRTYVNSKGHQVMLSIAYGDDQRDSLQLHLPDVCYPAQGFQVMSGEKAILKTERGNIPVKRLITMLGNRSEPLTYWTTVGNKVALGSMDTKLAQLVYGFRGEIPDGLIFRVSSISSDPQAAFAQQDVFASQLVRVVTIDSLNQLTGLSGAN